jgi:uncharacterized membrane protein YcaP (DUF421 family)
VDAIVIVLVIMIMSVVIFVVMSLMVRVLGSRRINSMFLHTGVGLPRCGTTTGCAHDMQSLLVKEM